MNRLKVASNVILLFIMLALSNVVLSAGLIIPGGIPILDDSDDLTSGGNTIIDTPGEIESTVDNIEQVMTVIKNEKPEVSGNLFSGSANIFGNLTASSVRLVDSPAGNFGFFDISPDGSFRYALKNDLPQVQALGLSDVAEEVFRYQIITTDNRFVDAKLTIFILGNPSVSFDNVEIEFNNFSAQATPLHAGNPSVAGQNMRGQLPTAGDRDWFVFNSLGNEIINLELCPEGSQCVDEKAWVMYVFDADKLNTEASENSTVTLRTFVELTNETLSSAQGNHMYLLFNQGFFGNSLIGVIDPCFGDRRTIDIGVGAQPKNYLVAISSPLARTSLVDNQGNLDHNLADDSAVCGSGDVVLEREIGKVTVDIDGDGASTDSSSVLEQFVVAFPFSDDQYTLKVTRTGADPFAVIPPDFTTFDAVGRKVSIPKIRVNGQLLAAELEQLNPASAEAPATFGILSTTSLNEPLTADPYLPTYNPANQIVKIPQVVIPETGDIFSVELLYLPENDTLNLLKAEPVN